jgi:hypothetical protein
MKTKETYFYIPTLGKNVVTEGIETVPGPQGFIVKERARYFVAFLDNIWPLKDFDVPWWILPGIGAAVILFGIFYFFVG